MEIKVIILLFSFFIKILKKQSLFILLSNIGYVSIAIFFNKILAFLFPVLILNYYYISQIKKIDVEDNLRRLIAIMPFKYINVGISKSFLEFFFFLIQNIITLCFFMKGFKIWWVILLSLLYFGVLLLFRIIRGYRLW
jgi:hypothetical protein